jgi:hypothetical protein
MLDSMLFTACFEFKLDRAFTEQALTYTSQGNAPMRSADSGFALEGAEGRNVYVRLSFVERGDPLEAFRTAQKIEKQTHDEDGPGATVDRAWRRIFTGVYVPITAGHYDFGRA